MKANETVKALLEALEDCQVWLNFNTRKLCRCDTLLELQEKVDAAIALADEEGARV